MSQLILGWGQTGMSIAKFFDDSGFDDYKVWDDFSSDIKTERKEESLLNINNYDKIYVSPGVPPTHPLILQATDSEKSITVETDLDIFFDTHKELELKIIGITGTNGKTTCAELLKEVLANSGFNVEVCANVGYPILNLTNLKDYDYLILELSSFQLHYVQRMKLDIAGIINITEDHIDWHGSTQHYQNSKLSISDYTPTSSKTILGTLPNKILKDLDMDQYSIIKKAIKDKNNISQDIQNVIHGVCEVLNISDQRVEEVLDRNRINLHRFEIIGSNDEFTFINDSKATNFSAVTSALKQIEKGLLILHGNLKGVSSSYLDIPAGIHSIVFYGNNEIEYDLDSKNIFYISDFFELPEIIDSVCQKGDTIILSPGGSSFEHFNDYKDRGNQFKNIIKKSYLQESSAQ